MPTKATKRLPASHQYDQFWPKLGVDYDGDIRFTTKGDTLYAIALGEPRGRVAITSLGRGAGHERRAT